MESALCFKVRCLWSWWWLTTAKNVIVKAAFELQGSVYSTFPKCICSLSFTAMLRHAWPVNSDNSDNVSSFVYHIWVFWCDLGNSKRNCKSVERFEDLTDFQKADSWFVFEQRGTEGNLTNCSCYLWRSVSHHSSLSNVRHIRRYFLFPQVSNFHL